MRKHADKFKVQLEGTPSNQPPVKSEEIKLKICRKVLFLPLKLNLRQKVLKSRTV